MSRLLLTLFARLFSVAFAVVALLPGCAESPRGRAGSALWVVTIPPLAEVLREIAGDANAVVTLLPPGASPHTYAPKPSDAAQVETARAVFYVAPNLDGWIIRYAEDTRVPVLPMVPESERLPADPEHGREGEWDPHFWMDPALMMTVTTQLADTMAEKDPARAGDYRTRAAAYVKALEALDAEIEATLAPVHGRAVLLVHPSLAYFLRRYGIPVAGYVEAAPGRKPSPQDLKRLIDTARTRQVRAVFSETQLPRQAVVALAEALGLPLYNLDPWGGVAGRDTYERLLRYNADVVPKALE